MMVCRKYDVHVWKLAAGGINYPGSQTGYFDVRLASGEPRKGQGNRLCSFEHKSWANHLRHWITYVTDGRLLQKRMQHRITLLLTNLLSLTWLQEIIKINLAAKCKTLTKILSYLTYCRTSRFELSYNHLLVL